MLDIEVRGAEEMQAGMVRIADDLHGPPILEAMRHASLFVLRDAKRFAPANTGHLRASITSEIRAGAKTTEGIVGSPLEYAPFMEVDCRPHWPPTAPIRYWVMRKFQLRGKMLESVTFLVRRKIARYGTKGRHYLQRAFEENAERVHRIIGQAVGAIIDRD